MNGTKSLMNFIGDIPRPLTCLSIGVLGLKSVCPISKDMVSKTLCFDMMSLFHSNYWCHHLLIKFYH